jgi:hypothetical protein
MTQLRHTRRSDVAAQTEFDLRAQIFSGSLAKAGAGSGQPKERSIIAIGIPSALSNAARGPRATFGDQMIGYNCRIGRPH